jgi:hypothetical protein
MFPDGGLCQRLAVAGFGEQVSSAPPDFNAVQDSPLGRKHLQDGGSGVAWDARRRSLDRGSECESEHRPAIIRCSLTGTRRGWQQFDPHQRVAVGWVEVARAVIARRNRLQPIADRARPWEGRQTAQQTKTCRTSPLLRRLRRNDERDESDEASNQADAQDQTVQPRVTRPRHRESRQAEGQTRRDHRQDEPVRLEAIAEVRCCRTLDCRQRSKRKCEQRGKEPPPLNPSSVHP